MNPELHPDVDLLRRHLDERSSGHEAEWIESHLSDCRPCQQTLARLAAESDWWTALPHCLGTPVPAIDSGVVIGHSNASPDELWHVEHEQVRRILAPTDDPSKLGRIGGYEVVGIVGAGATAVVLKAFDGPLNRFVAIKLMRPTLAASPIARQRFSREARAAASIVHENVIEIHGVSDIDGLPYLVMPYVRGESLAKRIDHAWPMPATAMLNIACQVADGLSAAHGKGLIHRDVKPSNILLGEGIERLKLTDFGLARAVDDVGLTRSGTLAGTPEYMSPEQARGESIDHRSDLFSLGSVLYAMCTGRPPFSSDSCYGVLRRIVEEQPQPISRFNPDVPRWLSELVDHLMAKEPNRRPASADEIAKTLRQCLNHLHDPRQPLPEPLRTSSRSRKGRRTIAAALLLVASVVAVTAAMMRPISTAVEETTPQSTIDFAPPEPEITSDDWNDGVDALLRDIDRQLGDLNELIPNQDQKDSSK